MIASKFIIALIVSFLACLIVTPIVILLAKKLKVIDYPNKERKIHKKPTPLLGGLAIFLSFNLVIMIYSLFTNDLTGDTIALKNLIGIFIGSIFLLVGGFLDDKYNLKPVQMIVWPILAVASVIICGIGIDWITNPAAQGILRLDIWNIKLFWYDGFPYKITLPADIFTLVWMLGMIYTTKLLDGLDGLVSGITVIGAIFIFFTALNKGDIIQYDVALLSMILAGVYFGFLVFNFNPAAIFLGEIGSTLAGFLLGSISIVSGSKVGVTLMLLSIPVLDVLWTIIRRLLTGRKFSAADKKHLHFRLLDAGFSVKQAVLFLYFIAVMFGVFTYYLQENGISLFILGVFALLVFLLIFAYIYKKKKSLTLFDK